MLASSFLSCLANDCAMIAPALPVTDMPDCILLLVGSTIFMLIAPMEIPLVPSADPLPP